MVPPPKARFPLTMRSAGGSLRRASWWSLRRTALRSLGRCGRPKISVPANWKRIVYMYTSIIIQHHPTSSNIIHHHPTSSSYLWHYLQLRFALFRSAKLTSIHGRCNLRTPHIVNPCCLTHPFFAAGLKLRCLQRGCDRSCRLLVHSVRK